MAFQRDHFQRIAARSENLEEFDELARKALKERELRYKEWKVWKPLPVPPTPTGRWLRSKPRNPPALPPTKGEMADAYNRAGQRSITNLRLVFASDLSRIPKIWKSGDG